MSNILWQRGYSVQTIASPEFAWAYMTDVAHWDDPPAQFRLEGPFTTGGHGVTEVPGQPSRFWRLQDVRPIERYTIDVALDRAALRFEWRFSSIAETHTCLSQCITLEGENAAAYLTDVQQAFASNLELGMKKIATTLDRAYSHSRLER